MGMLILHFTESRRVYLGRATTRRKKRPLQADDIQGNSMVSIMKEEM